MEDHIYPPPEQVNLNDRLFIVCDGLGGHTHGEEASRITCNTIGNYFAKLSNADIHTSDIQAAVDLSVEKLKEFAANNPGTERMATTLALTFLQANGIWVAWCGDSRIYHIRNGLILWKSKDHSLVQQLFDAGSISEQDVKFHPKKNVLLNCISTQNTHTIIDTHFLSNILPGDVILLCTDGLLENIGDEEIMNILGPSQQDNDKKNLFLQYCLYKTSDNYSMYLLCF